MLARKGYGGGLAAAVVREALDARADDGRCPTPAWTATRCDLGEDALLP